MNSIHPKYNICFFMCLTKALYPELRGDSLFKAGNEFCIECEEEQFNEFESTYKPVKHKHIKEAFLEYYEGLVIEAKIDRILKFIKKKSNDKFTSI
jgi:hypothetical protein